MKKLFAILFSLVTLSASAADVAWFGETVETNALHPFLNYIITVLGNASNSPVRKISPTNLLETLKTFDNWTGGGGGSSAPSDGPVYSVDDVYGDDATAVAGSVVFSWKNVDTAHAAMTNAGIAGSILSINPHTGAGYPVTNALKGLPNRSSVIGNGYVQLLSYVNQPNHGPIFQPGPNSSRFVNLTVVAALSNSIQQSMWGTFGAAISTGGQPFNDALLENCRWFGDYDGIVVSHATACSGTIRNNHVEAKVDCMLVDLNNNHRIYVKDSYFAGTNASQLSIGWAPRGLVINQGFVRFEDSVSHTRASGAAVANAGVTLSLGHNDDSGKIELINSRIISMTPAGTNTALQILNNADVSGGNFTNCWVLGNTDIEFDRTGGPIEWHPRTLSGSQLIIPQGQRFSIQNWSDHLNFASADYFIVDPTRNQVIITNGNLLARGWVRHFGAFTNTGTAKFDGTTYMDGLTFFTQIAATVNTFLFGGLAQFSAQAQFVGPTTYDPQNVAAGGIITGATADHWTNHIVTSTNYVVSIMDNQTIQLDIWVEPGKVGTINQFTAAQWREGGIIPSLWTNMTVFIKRHGSQTNLWSVGGSLQFRFGAGLTATTNGPYVDLVASGGGGGGPSTNSPPKSLAINGGLGSTNIVIDWLALVSTNDVTATLTGNVGIIHTNVQAGKYITLAVKQDSTGNRGLSTNSVWGFLEYKGREVTGYNISTNANAVDLVRWYGWNDGSTNRALQVGSLSGYGVPP